MSLEFCVFCGDVHRTTPARASKNRYYTTSFHTYVILQQQQGHGGCHDVFVPELVGDLVPRHVTMVACGDTHTLAITADGQLWSFGRNQNGQLGLGTRDDSFSPQHVASLAVCV